MSKPSVIDRVREVLALKKQIEEAKTVDTMIGRLSLLLGVLDKVAPLVVEQSALTAQELLDAAATLRRAADAFEAGAKEVQP